MTSPVSPNFDPKKTSNEKEGIDQSLPTQVAWAAFRVATTVRSPESIALSAHLIDSQSDLREELSSS